MRARLRTAILIGLSLALGACGAPYLRSGDTSAHGGDWETALVQYRRAAAAHPESGEAARKLATATDKVQEIWTKRGNDANAAGRLGEAAEWWLKAVNLSEGEDAPKKTVAWKAIVSNGSALEYFGDVAVNEGRHEEALACYEAVIKVHGERVDLVQKQLDAQRAWATELADEAGSLERRNLPGAALVSDMRALQEDPLQQDAFHGKDALTKKLRSATRVALQEVKLDDHGYRGLGNVLLAQASKGLSEFPPYGPTKDPNALKATYKVSILSFEKHEETKKGVDEIANDEPASTVPVVNPAVVAQQKLIADLQTKLAQQQAEMKKAAAPASHKPTDAQKSKGMAAARAVDQTRAQLEVERAKLAALPPTVMPPPPPPTWQLPWTETTRTVEATVRFEVAEPDFAEPMVVELTHHITETDRAHDGNARHHVEPDPLDLPSFDQMVASLAAQFDDGAQVIGQAKARRVERLVAQGRELHAKGSDPEALDSFVAVIFLAGPEALPDDAAAFVAQHLDAEAFKALVAAN